MKYILFAIIIISFLFCLWLPLHNELIIQTDIARDFLLLEETVQKGIPPLIGAHSGIPGIFHGPLWFYINLPFFIFGQGNPAVVGFFWTILYAVALFFVFYCAKKLFNKEVALLSTALYAFVSVQEINNLSNPYGALILFPLFFYLFYHYLQTIKVKYLFFALFVLGLIIQFQMAFGVPVMILTLLFLTVFLIKKGRIFHLLSFSSLILTQLTFIFFEMRHNFLQTHTLINYLKSSDKTLPSIINFDTIFNQLIRSYNEGMVFFTKNNLILNFIFVTVIFIGVFYLQKRKGLPHKNIYLLFGYFYFGYWMLIMFYRDNIWIYYHWAFIPILIILFCSLYQLINKKIFLILFFIFIGILLQQQIYRFIERNNYMGKSQASWKFFNLSVDKVYKDAGDDFGYYVVIDDQLGYQEKYAFHYLQQFYPYKAYGFAKKKLTYVYLVPSSDRGYDFDRFIKERIKIQSQPIKIMKFNNGIKINKYEVTGDDLKIPSDPNLLNSMIFR